MTSTNTLTMPANMAPIDTTANLDNDDLPFANTNLPVANAHNTRFGVCVPTLICVGTPATTTRARVFAQNKPKNTTPYNRFNINNPANDPNMARLLAMQAKYTSPIKCTIDDVSAAATYINTYVAGISKIQIKAKTQLQDIVDSMNTAVRVDPDAILSVDTIRDAWKRCNTAVWAYTHSPELRPMFEFWEANPNADYTGVVRKLAGMAGTTELPLPLAKVTLSVLHQQNAEKLRIQIRAMSQAGHTPDQIQSILDAQYTRIQVKLSRFNRYTPNGYFIITMKYKQTHTKMMREADCQWRGDAYVVYSDHTVHLVLNLPKFYSPRQNEEYLGSSILDELKASACQFVELATKHDGTLMWVLSHQEGDNISIICRTQNSPDTQLIQPNVPAIGTFEEMTIQAMKCSCPGVLEFLKSNAGWIVRGELITEFNRVVVKYTNDDCVHCQDGTGTCPNHQRIFRIHSVTDANGADVTNTILAACVPGYIDNSNWLYYRTHATIENYEEQVDTYLAYLKENYPTMEGMVATLVYADGTRIPIAKYKTATYKELCKFHGNSSTYGTEGAQYLAIYRRLNKEILPRSFADIHSSALLCFEEYFNKILSHLLIHMMLPDFVESRTSGNRHPSAVDNSRRTVFGRVLCAALLKKECPPPTIIDIADINEYLHMSKLEFTDACACAVKAAITAHGANLPEYIKRLCDWLQKFMIKTMPGISSLVRPNRKQKRTRMFPNLNVFAKKLPEKLVRICDNDAVILSQLSIIEFTGTDKLVVISLDYDGTITDCDNRDKIINDIGNWKTAGYMVIVVVNTARLIYGRGNLDPDLLKALNITAVYMRIDTDAKCNSAKHAVLQHLIDLLANYSPTIIHYDDDRFTCENLTNLLQGQLNPVDPYAHKTIIVHCPQTDRTITRSVRAPNVAFVIGPPCSGKTTFADQLAAQYFDNGPAVVVCMDTIEIKELIEFILTEVHHDGNIPSLDDCRRYLKRNKQNSYQEFLRQIDTLLGSKTPIIICACTMPGKTLTTRQFTNGTLIPAAIFTTFDKTDAAYTRLIDCIKARISRNNDLPLILQSCALPIVDHMKTGSTLIEDRCIFDAVISKILRSAADYETLAKWASERYVRIHQIGIRDPDGSYSKFIDALPRPNIAIRTNTISSIRILFKPADGQSCIVYDRIVACLKKLFAKGKNVVGTNHITISYGHECPFENRPLTVYVFLANLDADVKGGTSIYIGKSTASIMVAINVGKSTDTFTEFYPTAASTIKTQEQAQNILPGEYILAHMTVALKQVEPYMAATELAHSKAGEHKEMFKKHLKNESKHIDADLLDDRGMADAMNSGKTIFKFTRMVETVVQPPRPDRIGKKK